MVAAEVPFVDRLRESVAATGSLLCLGLDPSGDMTVAEAERGCHDLLAATAPSIAAVKVNVAFFEQWGSTGCAVLERVCAEVRSAGLLLVVDAKRGDIGSTAVAYARALFDVLGADAVTVNPLLGQDSLQPFLDRAGRGVFVLARTSNPGSADLLDRPLQSGLRVFEHIVDSAVRWEAHPGSVGFVVGATAAGAVAAVRARAPAAPLLLPGVGAQGGDLEAAVRAATAGGAPALLPVSRGISADPAGARTAAARLRDRMNDARGRG